jgi:hypothetical protein
MLSKMTLPVGVVPPPIASAAPIQATLPPPSFVNRVQVMLRVWLALLAA